MAANQWRPAVNVHIILHESGIRFTTVQKATPCGFRISTERRSETASALGGVCPRTTVWRLLAGVIVPELDWALQIAIAWCVALAEDGDDNLVAWRASALEPLEELRLLRGGVCTDATTLRPAESSSLEFLGNRMRLLKMTKRVFV